MKVSRTTAGIERTESYNACTQKISTKSDAKERDESRTAMRKFLHEKARM